MNIYNIQLHLIHIEEVEDAFLDCFVPTSKCHDAAWS